MHLDKISDLLFSSFLGGHSAMANFSSRQSLHDLPPLNGGALAQIDQLKLVVSQFRDYKFQDRHFLLDCKYLD